MKTELVGIGVPSDVKATLGIVGGLAQRGR